MKNFLSFLLFFAALAIHLSAQRPQATETKALLEVVVTDFEENPRPNEVLIFRSKKSGKKARRVTGEDGTFLILLPEGDTYEILYKQFLTESSYSEIAVPDEPGMMEAQLKIKFRYKPAEDEVFALDIHFFTDESRIQEESYPLLNDLVEQLRLKPDMRIEVAGHTDDVGTESYNQKLSESRAQAVRDYLIGKKIAGDRIEFVGYGESQPVAANTTEDGRAKNRRTEVRILSVD